MLLSSLVSTATTNVMNYELCLFDFTVSACRRHYLRSEHSGWMLEPVFHKRIGHMVLMQQKKTEDAGDFSFFGANKAELL